MIAHPFGRRGRSFSRVMRPIAEVLESRHLLNGDLSIAGYPGLAVAAHDSPVETATYHVPIRATTLSQIAIDWGDGTGTTAGSATRDPVYTTASNPPQDVPTSGLSGAINGDHTYAVPGTYTVTTTTVAHVPGQADHTLTSTSTITVVAATLGNPNTGPVAASAGYAVIGPLTYFNTNIAHAPTALHATIDWGDGSTTTAASVADASQSFSIVGLDLNGNVVPASLDHAVTVSGNHAYAAPGTYTATIVISDATGLSSTAVATIKVQSNPLSFNGPPAPIDTNNGPRDNDSLLTLAMFTDVSHALSDGPTSPGYSATIDYGDGSAPGSGHVEPVVFYDGGSIDALLQVRSDHLYASAGDYVAKLTVTDSDGHVISTTVPVHVTSTSLTLGPTQNSVGGLNSPQPAVALASGVETGIVDADTSLAATIDWGDGSPLDRGTVIRSSIGGSVDTYGFVVYGSHIYASSADTVIHVTVTSSTGTSASVNVNHLGSAPINTNPPSGGGSTGTTPIPLPTTPTGTTHKHHHKIKHPHHHKVVSHHPHHAFVTPKAPHKAHHTS
jgi:large repetitive protein